MAYIDLNGNLHDGEPPYTANYTGPDDPWFDPWEAYITPMMSPAQAQRVLKCLLRPPLSEWFTTTYRSVLAQRRKPVCLREDRSKRHVPWVDAQEESFCSCQMEDGHLANTIAMLFRKHKLYKPSDRPLALEIRKCMVLELSYREARRK